MTEEEKKLWLAERRTYIGGSDIGCILGLSKYKSALDIYLSKTSDINDEATSEAAHWGNLLEDVIASEYAARSGNVVTRASGLLRHKEHSFIACNIDRWVTARDGTKYVLECKTAGFLKAREWGEVGSDQIPENYLMQVAYYSAICNVEKVDIAVLIGGQELRIYTYVKNEELENKLILAACAFWNNYVLKGIAPSASFSGDINNLYPKSNGSVIGADRETILEVEALKQLKEQEKMLITQKVSLESKIKACIGEHEGLIDEDGKLLVTWRNGAPRQVLDTKKLEVENANIYQQYLTTKESGRMFLLK
jgi:putative phage-type endonuclease